MTPPQLFDLNASRFGAPAAALLCEYRIRLKWRRALREHLREYENGDVLPLWKFHKDDAAPLRGSIKYLDGRIDMLRSNIRAIVK